MALKCSRYLILLIFLITVQAGSKCITLNGEEGTCVEYHKCSSLYKSQNNSVFHNQGTDFLIDSYCGWWSMPKVCCAKSNTYSNLYKKDIEKYNKTCGSKIDKDIRWLVNIKENCYGFLITDRYIVGKASCLDGLRTVHFAHQANPLEIIRTIKHPIASIIKEEYYNIGLIKLKHAVPYNPICISLEESTDSHIQDIGNKFWIVDPNKLRSRNFTATTAQLCPNEGYKTTICSGPCIKQSDGFSSVVVSEDFSYIQGLTVECNQNELISINVWYFQWWIASNIK